jgi:hypothetical protein
MTFVIVPAIRLKVKSCGSLWLARATCCPGDSALAGSLEATALSDLNMHYYLTIRFLRAARARTTK